MEARLVEWISEERLSLALKTSKRKLSLFSKREKVVLFLKKTGLLDILDVNDQDVLAPQAPAQTARLSPSHSINDDTIVVVANEFHDSLTEQSADFSSYP